MSNLLENILKKISNQVIFIFDETLALVSTQLCLKCEVNLMLGFEMLSKRSLDMKQSGKNYENGTGTQITMGILLFVMPKYSLVSSVRKLFCGNIFQTILIQHGTSMKNKGFLIEQSLEYKLTAEKYLSNIQELVKLHFYCGRSASVQETVHFQQNGWKASQNYSLNIVHGNQPKFYVQKQCLHYCLEWKSSVHVSGKDILTYVDIRRIRTLKFLLF